jgi:hypothetical protein
LLYYQDLPGLILYKGRITTREYQSPALWTSIAKTRGKITSTAIGSYTKTDWNVKTREITGWGQPPILFIELLHIPNMPLDILAEPLNPGQNGPTQDPSI